MAFFFSGFKGYTISIERKLINIVDFYFGHEPGVAQYGICAFNAL